MTHTPSAQVQEDRPAPSGDARPAPRRSLAGRAMACVMAHVMALALVTPAWAQAPTAAAGVAPTAAPGLVSTERLVQSMPASASRADAATGESARTALLQALDRQEVAQALADRGLSVDKARERVAALTDDEARTLAERIDLDPAGASEIISTIVFIFVLLLITDILGFTKIFPFTRAIR